MSELGVNEEKNSTVDAGLDKTESKNETAIVIHDTESQETPMDASDHCTPPPPSLVLSVHDSSTEAQLKAPGMF